MQVYWLTGWQVLIDLHVADHGDPVLLDQEEDRAVLRQGLTNPPGAGGSGYNANMAIQHQLGPQPSAPSALQFQSHQATCLADIENSLARMKLQLSSQKEQLENNKNSGASGSSHGVPRNQYPLV